MSIKDYVNDKTVSTYEEIKWNIDNSSFFSYLFKPFWWMMFRERGTEFPFYFPEELKIIKFELKYAYSILDLIIHGHESERSSADHNQTLVNRLKYTLSNFHYYSNDTMANLYYDKKLPLRDYQRLKHVYNQYCLAFLGYNTLSGVFMIMLSNYFFRSKRATLPVVFGASIVTFAGFMLNYKLSYFVADKMFGSNVRRLGYKNMIHSYGSNYPRNLNFIKI